MKKLFSLILIGTCISITALAEKKTKDSDKVVTKKENGKFVVLPLPFYETHTGYGLILKILHTDILDSLYVDSTSIATSEHQYVTFNSIGQKSLPVYSPLFWDLQLGATHLSIKYFGRGNHNDIETPAEYKHKSYIITPKVGITLFQNLKLYLKYVKKAKRMSEFNDQSGKHSEFWNTLIHKHIRENRVGYGLSYKAVDSETRPMEGVNISYDYLVASPRLMTNDYSFREAIFDFSFYLPVFENMSHGSRLLYQRVSSSAPFYEHPTIRVRGIEKARHKDNITFVIQNEERIYLSDEWGVVPFWDFGRVMRDHGGLVFHDFHYGYGLGGRYVLKGALVVRFDVGFSKGGETAFVFNYGHSF